MLDTTAPSHEGPKNWKAWMASQPESVQQDWAKYSEQHKDRVAARDKVAGYTHYWTYLAREEGYVDIDLDEVQSMLKDCRAKLLRVPEYEKALTELQDNPGGFVSPSPGFRFQVMVGRYPYRAGRAGRAYADLWEGFAESLETGGQRGLARTAKALAKAIPKTMGSMEKAEKTYTKHSTAYKPKHSTMVRAFERWLKGYKRMFVRMFDALEKIRDILAGQNSDVLAGFTEEEWVKLVSEAKKIVASASASIDLAGPMGQGAPEFTKEYIGLNGDESKGLDYESFWLSRTADPGYSDSCKTGGRPYDAVVVSILAAAQTIAPAALTVQSDGGASAIKRVFGCEGGDPVFHDWLNGQMASVTASWDAFKAASDDTGQEDGETKSGLPGTEDEKAHKKATRSSGRERLSWGREAASGLYGYTKRTQKDVQAAINRVKKKANHIARAIWSQDESTARFLQTHADRSGSLAAKILVGSMKEIDPRVASVIEGPQETLTKGASEYGLYGYRQKTARIGLTACSDLQDYFGREAYSLHTRRAARYDRITAFLKDHSKRGRCKYSRLLLKCYPPQDVKVASDAEPWLTWDE